MEIFLTHISSYLWTQSWQIAILAIVIAGLSFLLKNKSAHIRYLLWLILLVKCFVPPLLTIPVAVLPQESISQSIIGTTTQIHPEIIEPTETLIAESETHMSSPLTEPTTSDTISRFTLNQWSGVIWISGMVLFILIAVIKTTRLHHWLKQSRKPLSADQLSSLRNLFSEDNTVKFPSIWLVDGIGQPFVWGLFKGSIYLPSHFIKIESEEQRRGILSHELSHVHRFDAAVNLLQILAQIAFWFHPLVWWANKKIRSEREKCCDEMAIAWLGTKARDFSTAIVNTLTAEHNSVHHIPSLAVAGPVKNIEDRIKTMMTPRKKFYKHPGILTTLTILLLAFITIPTTLALASRSTEQANAAVGATSESGDSSNTDVIDPNAIKEDIRKIAGQVVRYKTSNNNYPESLEQLGQSLPKDLYSLSGEDYRYESNRKRFIVSSCGIDHVYGNDDDPVYYVNVDHLIKRYGLRSEIYPIEEESEDINSQTEMAWSHGERPLGNCSISGKVVCAQTGEPIDHATVYLSYKVTHIPIYIRVAKDGSFVFKDIPTGPFSLRTMNIAGYQDAIYDPEGKTGKFPQFSLAEGEQRSGIILTAEPAFRISGKVLDENGDLPVDIGTLAIKAWAKNNNGGYEGVGRQGLVNKTDGSWSIDGLDGRSVYVMALDWRAAQQGNAYPPIYYPSSFSRNEATLITFDDGWDINNIDITLQKSGGLVLEGTVTDETGEPIPEAFIVIHRRDMLFDFVTAYTDEQGKYQIQGLAEGEFLVHADAVHRGFVRKRIPLDIDSSNQNPKVDFVLKTGITISGKFVDADGNDWQMARSYGYAQLKNQQGPSSSFSVTHFRNKYRPKDVNVSSGGSFDSGQGDYTSAQMIFTTQSTFIIQGVMPGQTRIIFTPNKEGQEVLEILYNGQNIMETGIETQAGEEIKDVMIVIGTP